MMHTTLRNLFVALIIIALMEAAVLVDRAIPAGRVPVSSTPSPTPHPGQVVGSAAARAAVEAASR